MKFRPYMAEDAKEILSWIKDEREFRLWSADRYENYPALPSDINDNYIECGKTSDFFAFTLEDEGEIIGHLILRVPEETKETVRLGFIIVNRSIRGKGYGRKLIEEAIKYAKNNLNAKEINLGVFDNNKSAFECYKAVGFEVVSMQKGAYQFYDEQWDCAEMVLKK